MSGAPFRRRTTVVLVVICAVSFVGLGVLAVFGPEFSPTRSGEANVFSTSAVGHGALHDLLTSLDIPVLVHRNPERPPLQESGVLLVLEPQLHLQDDAPGRPGLAQVVSEAPAVLLALPKWQVRTTEAREPRVEAFAPWPEAHIRGPLEALGLSAELIRLQMDPEATLPNNPYELEPVYASRYRQYITSDVIEPLIGTAEAMLLGRVDLDGVELFILADPDLLQNHGLHRDPNAQLVVTWIDALRGDGPVVFDEVLHGFPPKDERLLRELLRFPLVLSLVHVLFVVALLLWGGLARFGDAPAPAPEVQPGSGFLIQQTAHLLEFTGQRELALQRYVRDTAREVALRFRLPADLKGADLDARLDELGAHRGVTSSWTERKNRALDEASRPRRGPRGSALSAAYGLHQWKQEILDGTRSGSRDTQSVA